MVLNFLNPLVLWGLFAISIPIIIHLFNLRRVKRVEFSNIALLKRIKKETSSKKRPVEILILISRILFISFLVIAFSQPISRDNRNTSALNDNVLIYLDNSLSMQRYTGSQSNAFDMAYTYANAIVDAYPENTTFKLIENNYSNSLVVNYSKETIKDRLTELEFSSISRGFTEIQQRLTNSEFKGDVYLISDFQKSTDDSLDGILLDTANSYNIVPVELGNVDNLYFDSAYLENSFLLGELKNDLKVLIKNSGNASVEGLNVQLFFENQLTSTALIDLPPNSDTEHSFEIDGGAEGLNRVRVTLDDSGVDFDNQLYLTLNNIEKINVFEIKEPSSGKYIEQLYGDNELFTFQSFAKGNIDLTQLITGDIIIVNEVTSFSNQLTAALKEFAVSGGRLVIIPARSLGGGTYADLGLQLSNDTRQRIQLSNPDLSNPFFSGIFEEDTPNISMPEGTTYLRLRNQELSLLDFRNGRSFLSKVNTEGSIYFFSCSFEEEMTSFSNHSIFVPVMYKLALGSKVNLSRLYYSTNDEAIVYPVEGELGSDVVTLRSGDEELTPDQRFSGTNLIMEVPKDELKPGHFDVNSQGSVLGTIAFNLPKQESQGATFTREELSAMAVSKHINLIEAKNAIEVNREITSGIKGMGLWRYALLLALLFLFVEIILIRYL